MSKIYVVHSVLRGKNNKTLCGIKIEGAFAKQELAEAYAEKLANGETIIQGELVEIRTGLTELDLQE